MIITIISILITITCLAVLVSIIAKKWNTLGAIDVYALPSERDARTKKKILSERMKRRYRQLTAQIQTKAQPLRSLLRARVGNLQDVVSNFFVAFQHRNTPTVISDESKPPGSLERNLTTAERLRDEGLFDEAEKRYIDIIAKDAKNLDAYEGLAQIYIRKKEWAGAQEVLEFLCTHRRDLLTRETEPANKSVQEMHLAESLRELAEVYLCIEKMKDAERTMQESLELQPHNPKFLDACLEMYIILGKKREARAVFSRLRDANPENQKLKEFEGRIENV